MSETTGLKKAAKKSSKKAAAAKAAYPRQSIAKVLRIAAAILEQNAGKDCSEKEAATFVGVGYGGPFQLEISSALKFSLLTRPAARTLRITDIARRILRPQEPGDDIRAKREAVLGAPSIGEVYEHYRGEFLPERKFFDNALVDKFGIPAEKVGEFTEIFLASLEVADLVHKEGERIRLKDVSDAIRAGAPEDRLKTRRLPLTYGLATRVS